MNIWIPPENKSKNAWRGGASTKDTKSNLPITGIHPKMISDTKPVNEYTKLIMIVPDIKLPNKRRDIEMSGASVPKMFGITNGKIGSKNALMYPPTPEYLISVA